MEFILLRFMKVPQSAGEKHGDNPGYSIKKAEKNHIGRPDR